ncbi:DNA polymerase III subunit delta' [Luteimonas sp. SX5]|uniref:DNA-directed DNA polymerase n=1 Tax=Luteimonas galliterrae TaxID=2940486 RepID=A0ABT0MGM1_9GAMM|nr:DNA polymerase III subunit delta' [Luteimonas galliterrae]MCL1634017.1 DNA polymerase III subunit delta' [Luteimonas galliterrae]
MSASGNRFAPWQRRAYDQACEAIDAGRLAHGMLFCGPANLGKRAVAERLAQRLLCVSPGGDGEPCGHCRGCQLLAAGTHPDFNVISFVFNREGTRLRTEIVIEQIRDLSEKLTLTPQYGGAQVAIIDPADAINHAACNALLKTLEEPVPGRYLWLVSAHPARLPATIRSRCQKLEFRLPPQAEAVAWLSGRGHAEAAAAEALEAARGHPGLADAWLRDGVFKLRREVAADLARLRRGETAALETAQRWTADEHAGLRLRFAADLALAEAAGLTDAARTRSLAVWFDAANRTRDLLRTTVRADLTVADLLLSWRGEDARTAGGGR